MPESTSSVYDDPFDMEVRLCDDQGLVTDTPVEPGSPGTAFDPELTYLKLHNNLRARNSNPDTRKPVKEGGWACTSHAHLGGHHIRCTNPIHSAPDWRGMDATLRSGASIIIGSETFAAPGSITFPPMPPPEAEEFRSALSYADSVVVCHAPKTEASQNCRRWLIWALNVLRQGGAGESPILARYEVPDE